MKERSLIKEEYKWDLTKFCKSEDDFFLRLKEFEKNKEKVVKFEGKLGDEKTLLDCLKFEDKVSIEGGFLSIYASLRLSEDVTNSKINEMNEKLDKVMTEYSVASSFIDVEMSELSNERLKKLIENSKFSDYKRTLESILRHKKHILSKKEEKLLCGMSFLGGFSENFDKFDDGDLKFNNVKDSKGKEYELNHSNYVLLAQSDDSVLRKNVFVEFNGAYGRYINFLSSNYISDVKVDCYFSKIRGYKSCLDASIYNEEASEDVYNLLIKKVRENIDVFYDYMEIKRKMLKLKQISISDCFAKVCKSLNKKYTYDEAIDLIKKAVMPLGEKYVNLIQKAKDERWIDVFPNKGKDSGAFSTHTYGATPVVLTNFNGSLDSVFTLAHELGHALHSYYSCKNQRLETSSYVIFVAEVASTTNEMLLLNYLLKNAKNKNEKMFYYDKLFSEVKGTIFRQTMFSEFEDMTHKIFEDGQPLSKDKLCQIYLDLNKFYFGKKVKILEEVKFEWARIPHFYRSYYVYKYATGLICALNFSKYLFENNAQVRDNYLKFLSAGSSASPIKILQDAGCNLEEENTFDVVFEYLRKIIKDWEKLLRN